MLLSIDTCGSLGTVALARLSGETADNLHVLAEIELPGKTYSAQLIPAIQELLATHRATVAGLEAIAVTSGPGSFTGIRIGLSAAKGLAEAHGTPILAVSRLAVLAHKAGNTAAALDASRGEFYFGDYSGAEPRECLLPRSLLQQEAAALGGQLAIGEESLVAAAPNATFSELPAAEDALRFALPRLRARDFDDPVTLDGHYIRRSDAEIFSKPKTSPPAHP